jgi:hypothetical protein
MCLERIQQSVAKHDQLALRGSMCSVERKLTNSELFEELLEQIITSSDEEYMIFFSD